MLYGVYDNEGALRGLFSDAWKAEKLLDAEGSGGWYITEIHTDLDVGEE